MRKIILYIAMSLDGYIADSIDTVILGHNTYEQIINELSVDSWVYSDKTSYVVTHKELENKKNIFFINDLPKLIKKLQGEEGKDIWICGGATIINELIDLDLIDRYCITIIPTLLGSGISLFNKRDKKLKLKLISIQSYDGMTDLIYERRDKVIEKEVEPASPKAQMLGNSSVKWIAFEDGTSIGTPGFNGGTIIADEEFDDSVRVTMEKNKDKNEITCVVYGALAHTFICEKKGSDEKYELIKEDLKQLILQELSGEDEMEFYKEFVDKY